MAQHETRRVDAQRAADAARFDRAHHARQLLEEGRAERVEMGACGGRPHRVPADALEERHAAELLLEAPHLLVDARLRDRIREGAGRPRVAAGARHPVEAFEPLERGNHSPGVIDIENYYSIVVTTRPSRTLGCMEHRDRTGPRPASPSAPPSAPTRCSPRGSTAAAGASGSPNVSCGVSRYVVHGLVHGAFLGLYAAILAATPLALPAASPWHVAARLPRVRLPDLRDALARPPRAAALGDPLGAPPARGDRRDGGPAHAPADEPLLPAAAAAPRRRSACRWRCSSRSARCASRRWR